MKNIIYCIGAAAMLLAVSCAKEQAPVTEPADNLVKMTFTATTDMATKTSLHTDGKSVNWSEGDKISVFAINEGAVASHTAFAAENIKEGTTADFIGATDADATDFVALYPYNSAAKLDVKDEVTTIETKIPAVQYAVEGGFDSQLNLMLATTDKNDAHFSFKNLCSLVKFTVPDGMTGLTAVTLRTSEHMAGTFKYDVTNGAVVVTTDNPSKTISLMSQDGSAINPGTYYLVFGPAGKSSYIQSVSCAFNSGEIKTITKDGTSIDFASNKIYNLGTINLENASTFAVTNAPQGDFPMGVASYQLEWTGAEKEVTFVARNNANQRIANVDANGLVTFTGKTGVEFIHVKHDGIEVPIVFNVVKGYYREEYGTASWENNPWYEGGCWSNSAHKAKDPEVTDEALKIYPKLSVKDNNGVSYNTYRCDLIRQKVAEYPMYLNIDYPIVCFYLDDVKDIYGVNRNITFDVVEKDGGIGGPVQSNNVDGKYKYTIDGKKLLIYDLTQQKIGGKNLADYGLIEFSKTFQLKYADINNSTKKTDFTADLSLNFYGFHTFRTLADAKAYFGITE